MLAEWEFPWPPTATNRMYRVGRQGHIHIDEKALLWKNAVKAMVHLSRVEVPKGQHLSLWIFQYPPPGWKGDTDGMFKLIQDAVFLGLDANDYWVSENHNYRGAPCGTIQEAKVVVRLGLAEWKEIGEVMSRG